MIKLSCLLMACLAFTAETAPSERLLKTSENKRKLKNYAQQRKLFDNQPFITNHVIHHQPYYASGYGPFHTYAPLTLPPPSPMIAMPPSVPPPPPIFTTGQLPIQTAFHVIHHPQHMGSIYNVNGFEHLFNPYLGHQWPNGVNHPYSYGTIPYGLHPFSYPGVGGQYGMLPYYNPYMSMMQMGSMAPFMGASLYPISHIAGAYGLYGPANPANPGDMINTIGGTNADEDRPAYDVPMSNRQLKGIKSQSDASNINKITTS